MSSGRLDLASAWTRFGSNVLPFADVATAEVPLRRLLRLSLFQVSVGMAAVMLIGTLNRVMIVELHVPASLVAIMLALPLLFATLLVPSVLPPIAMAETQQQTPRRQSGQCAPGGSTAALH